MEFQIDINYKSGGKDFTKALDEIDLIHWVMDADFTVIESFTVKEWKD